MQPGAHAYFMMFDELNIMVQSLVHLLHIQDNLGSNLGLENGYPHSGVS
jgi:hypothetical protein